MNPTVYLCHSSEVEEVLKALSRNHMPVDQIIVCDSSPKNRLKHLSKEVPWVNFSTIDYSGVGHDQYGEVLATHLKPLAIINATFMFDVSPVKGGKDAKTAFYMVAPFMNSYLIYRKGTSLQKVRIPKAVRLPAWTYYVLKAIHDNGGSFPSILDLARTVYNIKSPQEYHSTRPRIIRHIKRLQNQGLVTRKKDGIRTQISITPLGRVYVVLNDIL